MAAGNGTAILAAFKYFLVAALYTVPVTACHTTLIHDFTPKRLFFFKTPSPLRKLEHRYCWRQCFCYQLIAPSGLLLHGTVTSSNLPLSKLFPKHYTTMTDFTAHAGKLRLFLVYAYSLGSQFQRLKYFGRNVSPAI